MDECTYFRHCQHSKNKNNEKIENLIETLLHLSLYLFKTN